MQQSFYRCTARPKQAALMNQEQIIFVYQDAPLWTQQLHRISMQADEDHHSDIKRRSDRVDASVYSFITIFRTRHRRFRHLVTQFRVHDIILRSSLCFSSLHRSDSRLLSPRIPYLSL